MNALTLLLVAVNAVAQTPAAPAKPDAAKLFAAKCASCHAKDATGNPMLANMFKAKDETKEVELLKLNLAAGDAVKATDSDLIAVIGEGRKKMPAFKGKLSDAEISALTAYIRALAPAPAAKAPEGAVK